MKLHKFLAVATAIVVISTSFIINTKELNAKSNPDGMPSTIGNAKVVVDLVTNTKVYSSSNETKTWIVIHDTAARVKGVDAKATRNYFQMGERAASANYAVDDHEIYQIVSNSNRAYHCGDQGGNKTITNSNSIGIELCVNTDGDWEKTMENGEALTKWLMDKYNIPADHVVRHYDVSGKPCPEMMLIDRPQDWPAFKKAIGGDAQTTETAINKKGKMTSSNALLMAPGTGSGSVYSNKSKVSVPSGTEVDVLAEHVNGHYLISYNNLEGYVPKSKVELEDISSTSTYTAKYNLDRNGVTATTTSATNTSDTATTTTTQVKDSDSTKDSLPYNPSLNVSGNKTNLADDVKLFKSPSEDAKEVGIAEAGSECSVTDKKNNWYKISVNGEEGWVPSQYVNNPNYKE